MNQCPHKTETAIEMNIPAQSRTAFALVLFLFLLAPAVILAQGDAGGENLEELRRAVLANSSLDDTRRDELLSELETVSAQREASSGFQARARQFKELMENADTLATGFEQQLEEARLGAAEPDAQLPEDPTSDQIRSQITLATAQRQALSERRAQLLQEADNLATRRAEVQKRLVSLQNQDNKAPSSTADTLEGRIANTVARARAEAMEAEREALEMEVLSEPARSRINAAERAWTGFALEQSNARLAALNDALDAARSSATELQLQATEALQQQLQNRDPALQDYAEQNRSLAEQVEALATTTDRAKREGQRLQATLEGVEQDALLMNRRLEVAGRKEVLGRVMITRLGNLPDTDRMKRGIEERNTTIADESLLQIDIEEEFRAINSRQDYLLAMVPDLATQAPQFQQLVNSLVDQRVELLEKHMQGRSAMLHQLLENNETTVALISATDRFHKFLLGNLLWVRNFTFVDMGTLMQQVSVVLSPMSWGHLPAQLQSGYLATPWSSALLVAILVAFLLRRQLRPVYASMMTRPVVISTATLWNMIAAVILSALLVLPWPLVLYCAGLLLEEAAPISDFSAALAPALKLTAGLIYSLLLTRLIASRQGVGRRHLKWNARMLDALRTELNWAGPCICVAALLDVFAFHLNVVVSGGPLGVLTTMAIAGCLIAMGVRLLRQESFSEHPFTRFSLRMLVIVAAAVVVLQLMGLLFAADVYLVALAKSLTVLGIIKLVSDVLERWLLILRARIERQARTEQDESSETDDDEESLIDVLSLSEAHEKLLNLGRLVVAAVALFVIWAPSLPALTMLDSVTLWQVADSALPEGALRAVTLFDLTVSAVIALVTGLLTKYLPSISEVFMREWFKMSAGARYATSILLQYLVIAVGASLFLGTIGWEWGKVQWLVAALGVGIGFGLQEIVANFISGIIILFERPVRVGDIISVGGAEGTVKKINPRATIIETFDRKEHLIPNKELITGEVINWTLSDGAVRVVIPVGIAYGADARLAMSLLLEAAAEVDNVLDEPQPRASFEDFGDNALVLWLRCYVTEDRIGTWTELRVLINEKYAAAGIPISFPQRDVHLDTLEPLQVELRHLGAGGPDSGAIPDR